MITGFAIILSFLFAGEIVKHIINVPIPGNIFGLLFLFLALLFKIIPLSLVEKSSTALLSVLGLFFVPAGIGIINQFQELKPYLIPILISATLGTLITAAFAGGLFQVLEKRRKRK